MSSVFACSAVDSSSLELLVFFIGPGLALATAGFVVKYVFSRFLEPRPSIWALGALTALEPFAYLVGIAAGEGLPESIVQWHINAPVLALCIIFVSLAGLHGALLGRTRPDIGEAKRLGLSLLYTVPVPAIVVATSMMFVLM